MQIDSALQAFSFGSGISASDFNMLIRTIVLAAFLMWGAWCVLALLKYYKAHSHSAIANLLKDYVQLFILVSIVISLVFIK
jgi:hypothetical protein